MVRYEGEGTWFLDRIREGLWRLEVYPDAVPVRDPFELQSADKIVTRAIYRSWPMTVTLPGLGGTFQVQPLAAGNPSSTRAAAGTFMVRPGVYLLSATGPVDAASLPKFVAGVGLAEFHHPGADSMAPVVTALGGPEHEAGRDLSLSARVVGESPPDSVTLFIRRTAGDWYRGHRMAPSAAYQWTATVPGDQLTDGWYEYVITTYHRGSAVTYPEALPLQPWDWNYYGRESWPLSVATAGTPIQVFSPSRDASRLAFTRIGDAGRRGLFRIGLSAATGRPVFRLELPVGRDSVPVPDYTASLVILDRVRSRGATVRTFDALRVRARAIGAGQRLHLTLMEDDGTSWTTAVTLDSTWTEHTIPLTRFSVGRGVLLPQGFPGEWNYWVGTGGRAGRGGGPSPAGPTGTPAALPAGSRREEGRARKLRGGNRERPAGHGRGVISPCGRPTWKGVISAWADGFEALYRKGRASPRRFQSPAFSALRSRMGDGLLDVSVPCHERTKHLRNGKSDQRPLRPIGPTGFVSRL